MAIRTIPVLPSTLRFRGSNEVVRAVARGLTGSAAERSFVVVHASEVRALENRVYRWSARWPRRRGHVGACSRRLRVVGSLLG